MTPDWINPKSGNHNRGGQAIGAIGLEQLLREMKAFPDKLSRKVLNGALRDSAQLVVRAARSAAPVKTGVLKRSIRATTVRKGRLGPVLLVQVGGKRVIKNRKKKTQREEDAFYAPWVEFGTKEHEIRAYYGPILSFGGKAYKKVKHPGAKASGFFGTAIKQTAGNATQTFVDRVRERLNTARNASAL